MSVGNAVGVSVKSVVSVGEIGVEVGIDVSVAMSWDAVGVGGGEEQDVRRERKRKEERILNVTCWDMDGILSHLLGSSAKVNVCLFSECIFLI